MSEKESAPIPISWVSREDLAWSRPDVAEQINQMSDTDLDAIAEKIGDALQETYWLAMGIVLDDFFGPEADKTDTRQIPLL